jgi:hypothetical protein
VVTAGTLATRREACRAFGGGDSLLPVTDHQPALDAAIADAVPPLLALVADVAVHGRPACCALPIWRRQQWQERGASLTIAVDAPAKAQHGRLERRILWAPRTLRPDYRRVRGILLTLLRRSGAHHDGRARSAMLGHRADRTVIGSSSRRQLPRANPGPAPDRPSREEA